MMYATLVLMKNIPIQGTVCMAHCYLLYVVYKFHLVQIYASSVSQALDGAVYLYI